MNNKAGFLTFIFMFLVSYATAAVYENNGVTVQQAVITEGIVSIKGSGAPPYANIEWEGDLATQVDANGRFKFVTDVIPTGCVGRVFVDGIETTVYVLLNNCHVEFYGYYSPPQVTTTVRAGEWAELSSECDAGDDAVNAGIVVYGAKYITRTSGPVVHSNPVRTSWGVRIENIDDTNDADFRLAAICADFGQPHGLNMNSN